MKNRFFKLARTLRFGLLSTLLIILGAIAYFFDATASNAVDDREIVIIHIEGTINPASDDYLRTSLRVAEEKRAKLFIIQLNTPGGLLPSMQSMVEALLQAKVPTVVYVSPQGGGAMSAGVFVTMAAHIAVMAPGTTIGAAHPVLGNGGDIGNDMREKLENYTVSLSRAIAEQRGRNVRWAEEAVRESVAITDREAVTEKVVDFSAADMESLLAQLEGRTININGTPTTLEGLASTRRTPIEMSLRQQVANFLADPNIAMLFGLVAIAGIWIELTHPGMVLPGIVGVVCFVLALTAGQILPLNIGGLLLLLLGIGFFVAELFAPSFGVWGVAGLICFVLGSIYFVDTNEVWSGSGLTVDKTLIGSLAFVVGGGLLGLSSIAMRSQKSKFHTGKEGLSGKPAKVLQDFQPVLEADYAEGRVSAVGEIWKARVAGDMSPLPVKGDMLEVHSVLDGLTLLLELPKSAKDI